MGRSHVISLGRPEFLDLPLVWYGSLYPIPRVEEPCRCTLEATKFATLIVKSICFINKRQQNYRNPLDCLAASDDGTRIELNLLSRLKIITERKDTNDNHIRGTRRGRYECE